MLHAGLLEFGHQEERVEGGGQIVKAGANDSALRDEASDGGRDEAVDPVIAAVAVDDLSGEGALAVVSTPSAKHGRIQSFYFRRTSVGRRYLEQEISWEASSMGRRVVDGLDES